MDNGVVTFGEIMLRLSPPEHLRHLQTHSYCATFAGSEANVAVSLANYGEKAKFISKLPEHEVAQTAINSLRQFGVDTSEIARGGERLGLFYLEKGASQRPSKVIYDRKNSAFAQSLPSEYDWAQIFEGAVWFHFSGITPALSENTAEICLEACMAAKDRGLIVSCDINYRENLWSREKANGVMSKLMQYVTVCFANELDLHNVFNIAEYGSCAEKGILLKDAYCKIATEFRNQFDMEEVVISLRASMSADYNVFGAVACDRENIFFSQKYDIQIVDRVGSGDSLAAGYIYARKHRYNLLQSVEFAAAAGCLKHSIEGDYNQVSLQEINRLISGDSRGRVQR